MNLSKTVSRCFFSEKYIFAIFYILVWILLTSVAFSKESISVASKMTRSESVSKCLQRCLANSSRAECRYFSSIIWKFLISWRNQENGSTISNQVINALRKFSKIVLLKNSTCSYDPMSSCASVSVFSRNVCSFVPQIDARFSMVLRFPQFLKIFIRAVKVNNWQKRNRFDSNEQNNGRWNNFLP